MIDSNPIIMENFKLNDKKLKKCPDLGNDTIKLPNPFFENLQLSDVKNPNTNEIILNLNNNKCENSTIAQVSTN